MKKTLAWRQRRYSISIDIQIQEQACFLSLLTLLQAQSWRARIKKKNQLCARKKQYIPSMVRNTMQNPLEFQKREKCRRKYSEELINNIFRPVYKFLCVYEGHWHSAHTVSRIRHGNLPSKQVTQNPTAHLAFFPGKIRKENKWG